MPFTTIITQTAYANASLGFSPQRVVMEDRTRTTSLRLTNRGDKTGTFRISLSDVIYNVDGSVKHVKTPPAGFPSAKSFVRFSPRQVRLAPGETQRVRVLLKSSQLAAGEYRIHAVMQQIPEADSFEKSVNKDSKAVSGKIGMVQAVAIPIIVRRGETSVKGGITSANRTGGKLNVSLWRTGNRSIYANLEVYAGAINEANKVTVVRGVAVPVPNTKRTIQITTKDQAKKPPYIIVVKDHDTGKIIDQKTVN